MSFSIGSVLEKENSGKTYTSQVKPKNIYAITVKSDVEAESEVKNDIERIEKRIRESLGGSGEDDASREYEKDLGKVKISKDGDKLKITITATTGIFAQGAPGAFYSAKFKTESPRLISGSKLNEDEVVTQIETVINHYNNAPSNSAEQKVEAVATPSRPLTSGTAALGCSSVALASWAAYAVATGMALTGPVGAAVGALALVLLAVYNHRYGAVDKKNVEQQDLSQPRKPSAGSSTSIV